MAAVEEKNGEQVGAVAMTPEEEVVAAFSAEIEDTARIVNPPAITELLYFPDGGLPAANDDLPPQGAYDEHAAAMGRLVEQGILQTGEYLEITVYGLKFGEAPDAPA